MIEIRIPKEIRTYKEKLFFGLTLRQLICTTIAIFVNVPLYWFGKDIIGAEAASWVVILIAMPLFLIGYFTYNGMTFEQFLKSLIQHEFIYPQKRKYETLNIFEVLAQESATKGGKGGKNHAVSKPKKGQKKSKSS
ncbi:PrgI family protein [Paenibacillus odorifer]|uniref:PrgI family protein n=1 Tax=Paenibacillus odorifer TaxID=189426 RepID=A0A1R0XKR6_9BACL|nr:PrgI family protein [Paenibacillus odorifer]OMD35658.1 PrgI family protein [Paenibacillus odorifer]